MGADQSQLAEEAIKQNNIGFFINGKEYSVNTDVEKFGPKSLLVDYIRDYAGLKGTKYMCREGGCGCCVVTARSKDPNTGEDIVRAVTSCLIPLFSCDGWDITTVEKVGNKRDGYHPIQKRLASFNGTQCGFCSPGMVMSMYSLTESKQGFKVEDVEDNLDGNVCRCTGYRPILDAFKSLAGDASEELRRKCGDIENCGNCPNVGKFLHDTKTTNIGAEDCNSCHNDSNVELRLKSGEEWVKATTIDALFGAIMRFKDAGLVYRLVAGNTGSGIFKNDGPFQAYIDINWIPEFSKSTVETSRVELGGTVTLSKAIDLLKKASALEGYEYAGQISKHLQRVANVPVRNAGTLAGNLMMKHAHREFPSDVFMLLETVGAKLSIASAKNLESQYSALEFLNLDMNGKVIASIQLPLLKGYTFRSFKIARRYQNAHSYVNAGFLLKVDPGTNFSILEKPTIVFGGINPNFSHASETELFLLGKFLGDPNTLQGALEILEKEIQPDHRLPDASPEYRKGLAQALFYKFVLGIVGDKAPINFRSGAEDLEHLPTQSKQTFDTDKTQWPLYEPVQKLEAAAQCAGEAQYINDINPEYGELFGAFVLTTVAIADVESVDASKALEIPGVAAFVQAKDIPGINNFMVFGAEKEEIFLTNKVINAGQSVGLILAESREIAFMAAKQVKVNYANVKKPILKIKDALKKAEEEGKTHELILEFRKSSSENVAAPSQILKGEIQIGGQYALHMETQICICIPREDGIDVFSSTQWMDLTQAAIASALNIPNNDVNIQIRRLGGAYGAKISRASHVAAACAVAAHVTNKPVRIVLDLETNMKMVGKRLPYLIKYEAGIDDSGNIVSLKVQLYCDNGCASNEPTSVFAMLCVQSCYKANGWELIPSQVKTDTTANTYCRAPGSIQGIAAIEYIMEHIAHVLKKDPLSIRELNFIQTGDPIFVAPGVKLEGENPLSKMIQELKESADYDDRKNFIDNYNQNNRWRKRGMALVPMRYPCGYFGAKYPVYISVYHIDGTVAVCHGGIEMGQGINTKIAQCVAYGLNIPLDKIKVKPSNNLIGCNAEYTGGSTTSELVCFAAIKATKVLVERMAPFKEKLINPTWEALVAECQKNDVDLTSHHQLKLEDVKKYNIWGLLLTEVEVDVLTGEYKIVRVDIVEDVGKSLNPKVDIGQVEGAVIMGFGMWSTEKLVFDEDSGELLTHNTWEYKPPFSKDIPEDLRITLLRNGTNPIGILSSKAAGESPICMSVSFVFAMKNAMDSARQNSGNTDWYQIDGPVTPEDIFKYCLTSTNQFTF